ncbi:MAG: hypothetical protein A2289_21970 [Deltaproteobacteria bacterium RIFOXYA12_FULL_58_15]|nr:MAG: hypothetical protein A2289_21970 [Deltaproteobacteria bacterium RIFOXYA12_FULL_58_15]
MIDRQRGFGKVLPDSIFARVCLASALVHLFAALALHLVQPPPYYGWDASDARVLRLREPDPRPPLSPEPHLPIVWYGDVQLTHNVRLRTFDSMDPTARADLLQIYKWALELFPAFVGRQKQQVGTLDLRVVPVGLLNNPLYFDVDNDGGTLYGLYYSRLNVAYVTHEVTEHPEHLVHELAHHFFDGYEIYCDDELEEVRARRFEAFFRSFLSRLASDHVDHNSPPDFPTWTEASTAYFLDEGVTLRSMMPLTRERIEWIRKLSRIASSVLPIYTGRFADHLDGIEIRIVEKRFLRSQKKLPHTTAVEGRYYPEHGLVYVSPKALENADMIGHFLAHHFLRHSPLSREEKEMLSHSFGYELDQRMLSMMAMAMAHPR